MEQIFVNQVGYFTQAKKIAIMKKETDFLVVDKTTGDTVYQGHSTLVKDSIDKNSGDIVYYADFSNLKTPGRYVIKATDHTDSPCFTVGDNVYEPVCDAVLKMFYFQRCGMELEEKYAGVYKHPACHLGKAKVYGDTSNNGAPRGLEMTGGWHDAGDFGRYTTAGAVALGHLLYAYEYVPEAFTRSINIPESGNGVPDILNECRYELEWMLKMQLEDGSVYHKVTALRFAPYEMPEDDKDEQYLFAVSSMAVADFAAIMSVASRVYAKYDKAFADKTWKAAKRAYEFLRKHPEFIPFNNPEGILSGPYSDISDADERVWAAAEMLRMDKDATEPERAEYIKMVLDRLSGEETKTALGWGDVSGFAGLTLILGKRETATDKDCILANIGDDQSLDELFDKAERAYINDAKWLLTIQEDEAYSCSMMDWCYMWGSNMVLLNHAIILCVAHYVTGDNKYLEAANNNLHYLLGRNALGVSYVTGMGERAFKNPHNRPTVADGIEEPFPGLVSGGPNRHPGDDRAIMEIPKGTPPMKCFVDHQDAYSVNEIAIYWNSPAVFVTAYVEVAFSTKR